IALGTGHDPQAAHHVVVNLAATAVDVRIDRGKVVLHVDPLADHLRPGHDDFQKPAGGIHPIVVGVEKHPAVKIDRAGKLAPTDDKGSVARQPPFRTHLTPVAAPPADFPRRSRGRKNLAYLRKAGAAFLAISTAGLLEAPDKLEQVFAMRWRQV